MSTIQDAIKSVQDYGDQFTKALERHRGFLGDGAGTVYVADRDGYVYIRHRQAESADITGTMEPEEVIYSRSDIPPIEGYPVIFGRDIDTEDFQLLAADSKQLLGWIFDKYIKDHHEQHEFNEYDTVWIQKQAMLPLLVYPTSPVSTMLHVHHGWYQWDTDWHFFETTTSSELSSYIPTVSGKARFLLICIDGETETLHYESGDTFIIFLPPRDCEDRIPPPPEGKIPLAAIYLPYGTTSFDWDIIYDVRLLFSGGGSMSTGSAPRDAAYITLAYNDILSAERLLTAGHGVIVTDNGANDTVEISVDSAADYNWSGDHSFLSGIEFVGATGINSIIIPDGLVSALHVIDTGGTEFLRLDTDNNYFLIDPGAAGIKVGIGTATVPHGGVGWGKLAIDGTANSMAGPHVLVTTTTDDYPVFQQLNWSHDVIEMMFDAYYDGAYKSSDVGSNCNIRKRADQLDFLYDSGVAQGAAVVWNNGIVMDLTNGAITVGGPSLTVPAAWNLIVPDNVADAFGIDDVGGLEYVRIVSTNANPYFLIDPAAAGINVGIGIATPTLGKLQVVSAAGYQGIFGVTGGCAFGLLGQAAFGGIVIADNATFAVYKPGFMDAERWEFRISGGAAVKISTGGDFGIGVAPTVRLDVADAADGYVAKFFNDGNTIARNGIKIQCGPDDQSATFGYYVTLFDGDGGEEGGIRVNSGTVEIFQSSDRSLKTSITPTKYGLSDILKLNVVDFNWKRNPDGPRKCGMVAQEVEKVFPDAVGPSAGGELLALAPTALIPVAIRAIQELDTRLTKLEAT